MRIICFIISICFGYSCSKSLKIQNESETYFGHDLHCKKNYPKKIKKRIPLDSMKTVSISGYGVLSPKFSPIDRNEIAFTTGFKNGSQEYYIYNLETKTLKLVYKSTNDYGSFSWTNTGNFYYKEFIDTNSYEINVSNGNIKKITDQIKDDDESSFPISSPNYIASNAGTYDTPIIVLSDSKKILDTIIEKNPIFITWSPSNSKLGIIEASKKSPKITTLLHIFIIKDGTSTKYKTIQLNKYKHFKRYEFAWLDEENLIFIDPFHGICKLNINNNEYKIIHKFCQDWSVLEDLTISSDRKKLMFYEHKISYNSNFTSVTVTYILYTMNINGSELKELNIENLPKK